MTRIFDTLRPVPGVTRRVGNYTLARRTLDTSLTAAVQHWCLATLDCKPTYNPQLCAIRLKTEALSRAQDGLLCPGVRTRFVPCRYTFWGSRRGRESHDLWCVSSLGSEWLFRLVSFKSSLHFLEVIAGSFLLWKRINSTFDISSEILCEFPGFFRLFWGSVDT